MLFVEKLCARNMRIIYWRPGIMRTVEAAFREIEKARGCAVPDTAEQKRWVERHSGELMS